MHGWPGRAERQREARQHEQEAGMHGPSPPAQSCRRRRRSCRLRRLAIAACLPRLAPGDRKLARPRPGQDRQGGARRGSSSACRVKDLRPRPAWTQVPVRAAEAQLVQDRPGRRPTSPPPPSSSHPSNPARLPCSLPSLPSVSDPRTLVTVPAALLLPSRRSLFLDRPALPPLSRSTPLAPLRLPVHPQAKMQLTRSLAVLFAMTTMAFSSVHATAQAVDAASLFPRADAYNAAGKGDGPESDGRHEVRFTLKGCPANVKPKITGTSGSKGSFLPKPPGSVVVPADFTGSVYLIGEGCGKNGVNCQAVALIFMPEPSETVRSYINYDATQPRKFVYPVKARFDDNNDQSDAASIDCDNFECLDGSRDPDDFISNRIYSSTRGVGVDIVYDCTANSTAPAPGV
ncbi:uncharacterized protein PFL1_01901 [Pseudozyma flocculosa PF-1]|uniref:uncharacterized protein n=1 Tax=Pseudozyma flocculosa PF-1 TaxID=1277687 RepID=UPI00045603CC|nr:uncharacterized protein PFL1_01901 [Pseudozyma flocculosa PF-1]EPQ30375.1 hypothetical protein PFL1_01901 [Pseudozyma flocculosa PF-1]